MKFIWKLYLIKISVAELQEIVTHDNDVELKATDLIFRLVVSLNIIIPFDGMAVLHTFSLLISLTIAKLLEFAY